MLPVCSGKSYDVVSPLRVTARSVPGETLASRDSSGDGIQGPLRPLVALMDGIVKRAVGRQSAGAK